MNGFKHNYDFTKACMQKMAVDITEADPKNYDCYTVTIWVGPEVFTETSRNPYTAMAYALEALAKRLKNQRPETYE